MGTCLRLTGIATLLLNLQLFNPGKVYASTIPTVVGQNQQFFLRADNSNASDLVEFAAAKKKKFEPDDNKGPQRTQGSGTR